ncbi:hypothetical protein BHE74_00026794 [Ensete ventricosum]|nr:hypothetical protein BHE74_00026794 [Ensete ventricosum]
MCSCSRFRYIAPEQVPVAFGGLSNENDPEFTTADAVTEVTIKASSKQSIEIPTSEVFSFELLIGARKNYSCFKAFSDSFVSDPFAVFAGNPPGVGTPSLGVGGELWRRVHAKRGGRVDVVVALYRRLVAHVADGDLPKDSFRKRWPVTVGDLLPHARHGLGFVFNLR